MSSTAALVTTKSVRFVVFFLKEETCPFAVSLGPGCHYPLKKDCGLSVGIGRAEYCLNRNSCAALYPDVANCVCHRRMRGLCRVLDWLGHVVELPWFPPPSQAWSWLLSSFPEVYRVIMQSVFFLYLPEIMNMQELWSQTRYQLKG